MEAYLREALCLISRKHPQDNSYTVIPPLTGDKKSQKECDLHDDNEEILID